MFEHFDDPNPPEPTRHQRDSIGRRALAIRHRRRRRVAGTVVGLCSLGIIGLVAFASYDLNRLDKVDKVDVATQPAPTTHNAETILLVGTDRGLVPGIDTAGADLIAAVRLDSTTGKVAVLQIPRDLSAVDPRTHQPEKLAEIFRTGGAAPLVEAIHQTLGIGIQHYVQIDPAGFVGLVDAVGGANVSIPNSTRDGRDGIALPAQRCSALSGDSLLALARARSIEVQIDGVWTPDTTGDLGRMGRQNVLATALLRSFERVDLRDPATVHRLVGIFSSHVTVDQGLDADELIDLGRKLHATGADGIATAWLPIVANPAAPSGSVSLGLGSGWQQRVDAFEKGLASGTAHRDAEPGATPPAAARLALEAC